MKTKVTLDTVYAASDNVVTREIEGEIILIPLLPGTGDTENEPYNLNMTGQAIWQRLDGRKSLKDVVASLNAEFQTSGKEIEEDVVEFVKDLLKKKMLVEVSGT